MPLGVPCFVHELNTVAVEVGNVGGVVARREVGAIRRFAFVGGAGPDCGGVGGVDPFVGVADDPEIEPGFAGFAPAQPDARSDRLAGAVYVITDSEKIGDALGARGSAVIAERAPPERLQGFTVERQRLLDVGDGDVDVVDYWAALQALAWL